MPLQDTDEMIWIGGRCWWFPGAQIGAESAATGLSSSSPTAAPSRAFFSWERSRLSDVLSSAALKADSVQSTLCAYLSLIALTGLVINAIWHIKWADPIAALAVMPLILREGWEALRGKTCDC